MQENNNKFMDIFEHGWFKNLISLQNTETLETWFSTVFLKITTKD